MKDDYFKSYKYFKVIQLSALVIFALAFFCFLYFDKDLHYNIYTNRSLLTICTFIWAFMIYSLAALVWDFKQLEGNIVHDSALHKAAFVDNLTGIPNRHSCDQMFEKYSKADDISKMGCALSIISNLKEINENIGRKQGNQALQDFSKIFEKIGSKYGFVGRNSGNEFLFVMDSGDEAKMKSFVSDLENEINEYNQSCSNPIAIQNCYIMNESVGTDDFAALIAALYDIARRG